MMRRPIAAAVLSAGFLLIGAITPVAAATSFGISTPYPAIEVEAGNTITFALTIAVPAPERVALAVSGTPTGWTAYVRGGGSIVNAVYAGGSKPASVELSVAVPETATAGTSNLTVTATSAQGTRSVRIDVTVLASIGGAITLTTKFPQLSGSASRTFTYSLTLTNTGTQEATYTLLGQGPDGWTVGVHPASNAQALTDTVEGGRSDTLRVTAQPPPTVAAGAYPVQVSAAAAGQTANVALEADVTGSPSLTLETPNQGPLNATVTSGSTGTIDLVVANPGSTVLTNVTITVSAPTGWVTTFAPATIATLQPGATAAVTATVKPGSNALAGTYDAIFTATAGTATGSIDIRTTVQTSPVWALTGIGLIGLVVVGLAGLFRRFGQR